MNYIVTIVFLVFASLVCHAEESAAKRIIQKALSKDSSPYEYELQSFITTDSNGNYESKTVKKYFRKDSNLSKLLYVLESPKELKGMSLLILNNKLGSEQIWLYLPSIKKQIKLVGNGGQSDFLGTDYLHEDIMPINTDNFDFILDDENQSTITVDVVPKEESVNTNYSRRKYLIDASSYFIEKIQYFGKANELLKEQVFTGIEFDEEMINHVDGTSTKIEVIESSYKEQDVPLNYFQPKYWTRQ